jgi:hypothetical protein
MSCRPENLSCNHGENLILVLVFKIVVVYPHSQSYNVASYLHHF